jgi:hypothetical protein
VNRRQLLAAAAAGGVGALLVSDPALAASPTAAPTASGVGSVGTAAAAATTADSTVEPVYGAGLYDVDPDQGNVSQSPSVVVTGDIAAMPVDWSL